MNTVVYYPHVRPSPRWLRFASLCWDQVYCLVPKESIQPSRELEDLDEALGGLIRDVPFDRFMADAELGSAFTTWVEDRVDTFRSADPSVPDTTMGIFSSKLPHDVFEHLQNLGLASLEHKEENRLVPSWVPDGEFVGAAPTGGLEFKYNRLLEASTAAEDRGDSARAEALKDRADQLRQRNLVRRTVSHTVVRLPRPVALHYLSLCASRLATDERRDMVAAGSEYTDIVFSAPELRGEVATSVLEAFLPVDLDSLPVEQLCEFRNETQGMRLKYQQAIQGLVGEYEAVASEGALESLKGQIAAIGKERVEETQRAYRRAKIDVSLQAFGVSLTPPAVIGAAASAIGLGLIAPVGIAAALGLFGSKALLQWRKASDERARSPWSYVIEASSLQS